jgi:hypothetical protein
MMRAPVPSDRRGIALIATMLIAFAVSAIAIAAVMMTLNARLVSRASERGSIVDAAATAGLEEARSRLNGQSALYPTGGFITLENNAPVRDASNAVIPGVTRSVWAGPSGVATGQYGVVGSIIALAQDANGSKSIRRLEMRQESFAKFSYFTNSERDTSGSTVVFGGGDQLRGPVHSNDQIRIHTTPSPAATFFDQVSTALTIINQGNGNFLLAPQLGVPVIPMPTVADLNKLDSLALVGGTRFAGSTAGRAGEARTRVHFFTIDLGVANGGVAGFFMVYQGSNEDFVSASLPGAGNPRGAYLEISPNCGDVANGWFLAAIDHDTTQANPDHKHGITGTSNANQKARRDSSLLASPGTGVNNPARTGVRCYLGGDSILAHPAVAANWPGTGHYDGGSWVQAPGSVQAALAALGPVIAGRNDRNYLFPLNRAWNPNFKGVISVQGKVIVDGVVNGRVTVAATGNIIVGDDITYFQNPATRDCATGDIAGFFSGQSILVANNTINAPQQLGEQGSLLTSPSASTFRTYDDTRDELINGFILTLRTYGAEENSLGSNGDEDCLIGGTFNAGRGCLSTYGGIIQGFRGAVGLTSGEGYIKRYQYDACGATDPPPYYPTTGVFVKSRFYEMDPTRFSVAAWFAANQI